MRLAQGVNVGGYWANNRGKHSLINHQSTVFLFDPDTGTVAAMVGGNLLTALRLAAAASIKQLTRQDAGVLGTVGAAHQPAFQLRAAQKQRKRCFAPTLFN